MAAKPPKAEPQPSTRIPIPNYASWAKYDAWLLTAACCLICGISPKYRYRPPNTNHFPWFIVKDASFDHPELRRLWSLANSAIRAGKLYTSPGPSNRAEWKSKLCILNGKRIEGDIVYTFETEDPYVRSDEFLAWARGKGFDIPPELSTALPEAGTTKRTQTKGKLAAELGAKDWGEIEMKVLAHGIHYRKAGTDDFARKNWGALGMKAKLKTYGLLIELAKCGGTFPPRRGEKRYDIVHDLNTAFRNAFGLDENPFRNVRRLGTQSIIGSISWGGNP